MPSTVVQEDTREFYPDLRLVLVSKPAKRQNSNPALAREFLLVRCTLDTFAGVIFGVDYSPTHVSHAVLSSAKIVSTLLDEKTTLLLQPDGVLVFRFFFSVVHMHACGSEHLSSR